MVSWGVHLSSKYAENLDNSIRDSDFFLEMNLECHFLAENKNKTNKQKNPKNVRVKNA